MSNNQRMAIGVAGLAVSAFALLLACVWGTAIWHEFLRPSEPAWWVMPAESTLAGLAFLASAAIAMAFATLPMWVLK